MRSEDKRTSKAGMLANRYDQYLDAFMYPNNISRRAKMPTNFLFLTTGTRVICRS